MVCEKHFWSGMAQVTWPCQVTWAMTTMITTFYFFFVLFLPINWNAGLFLIVASFNHRIKLSNSCCECWHNRCYPLNSHALSWLNAFFIYILVPRLFLILWYLRSLQRGGLQRYLMLIVHMKGNLYEVRVPGTNWTSWGGTPLSSPSTQTVYSPASS